MCQIKSERATGEHHPPQLVMWWKSTQHITRKMGLRYISCGGTSPTTTGDVVEIHATHHQKNGATLHHPCFGDDKQKAFSRFGDDI
jgi:hypothetical protein